MQTRSMQYRADIDGLRALAVLPVLLFHSGWTLFRGGFVGVDIFFVISGFLISRIIWTEVSERRFSILRFYERRARRILPALFVVILTCFVVGYGVMLPAHYDLFGQSVVAAALSLSNVFFWQQSGYFAPDVDFAPLLHTWSLGVEEQFYLTFPLLLLVLHRLRVPITRVLPTLLVLAFALGVNLSFTRPFGAFYLLPARAWELLLGGCLGVGAMPPLRGRANDVLGVAGLVLVLGSIFLIDAHRPFPGWVALFPCLGAAALLHSGAQPTVTARMLSVRPIVFVGLISYSLYLWHWPVFAFARMLVADVHLTALMAAAAIALSLLLAALTWRYVEAPFRNPRTWSARGIAGLAGAGTLLLIALGLLVHVERGFPHRLGPAALAAQAAAFDTDPLRDRCNHYFEGGRVRECRFGPAGVAPSYVIIGDSHAAALRAAIDPVMAGAKRAGTLWWYHGCPPLLGARDVPQDVAGCDGFRTRFMADLRASPQLSTVILAGRWAPKLNGALPEVGDTLRIGLIDDQSRASTRSETKAVFARSLTRTIRDIRAMGKQVVLLGGVPAPGFDVPSILALARFNGVARGAALPLAEVERFERPADTLLARIAREQGARYIPLLPAFCTQVCDLERGGRPLYSDSNHLSLHAARTVVGPYLERAGLGNDLTERAKGR